MKSMYFEDQKSNQVIKKITIALSHQLTKLLPAFSTKLSYQILLNPFGRREYSTNLLPPHKEVKLTTKMGEVNLFHFPGGDKHVFLSHGWADSTLRFKHLIKALHLAGFSIWSIDHIGHGKSDGKKSHLFGFLDGLRTSLEYIDNQGIDLHSIIGHSMGGVGILNLEKDFLENKKVILLSLPGKFFENMFTRVNSAGISSLMLLNILEVISAENNLVWKDLAPVNQIHKINENFLFLHDTEDRIAKYSELLPIKDESNARLISTTGLGHVKILRDEKTLENIVNFLN
jgi:alpha/beta superfamily hydrolase